MTILDTFIIVICAMLMVIAILFIGVVMAVLIYDRLNHK